MTDTKSIAEHIAEEIGYEITVEEARALESLPFNLLSAIYKGMGEWQREWDGIISDLNSAKEKLSDAVSFIENSIRK